MSWAQAILLARGLSRGCGVICGATVTGPPFSQVSLQAPRGLHCSAATHSSDSWLVPPPPKPPRGPTRALAPHEELFRRAPDGAQDKANFVRAVQTFGQHNVHKRGHVDFIYLALRKMREYGVERDLAVYNLLLDVFPKEVFRPRSVFQRIFIHYPRQQECGIAVLEQMENHAALAKVDRNEGGAGLARRMPSAKDSTGAADATESHIVGIQTPDQQAALAHHNPARPIFVEGPFSLWLRDKCVYYHILRADLLPPEERDTPHSGYCIFSTTHVSQGPVFVMHCLGCLSVQAPVLRDLHKPSYCK
ncbi:evolutionarily conserved signaling intermediate in Toll pathway, mitochondrial [Puma concolor]|uniref:Evolutionarily conserved signaling intermediate in Toll pathway, mitochondrial n=1 Tax=Puma concolor TaxID=9696 RepID=A0A6P6H830_PUMCO|nr:evolutionarily conserved signaling intermediate in Toll pathway, mitochondrial [Puma concolor]